LSDNIVQIVSSWIPSIDWERANRYLAPLPGRCVVEMAPVPEMVGGLYFGMQEGGERRNRSDLGVVLAVGGGVHVLPGEIVAVDNEHGKWMEGCVFGDYEPQGQIRMYGRSARSGGTVTKVPWWRSILAVVDDEELAKVGRDYSIIDGNWDLLRPTDHKVLIERDPLCDVSEGGVLLTDGSVHRNSEGTVRKVGSFVRDVQVGDRVIYLANLVKKLGNNQSFQRHAKAVKGPGLTDHSLVLVEEDAILTVVRPSEIEAETVA